MPGARWFTGARVNFAAHLLARGNGDQIALYAASESGPLRRWSWHALREDVFALATALREHGVQAGDRVCAWLPNTAETVIGFLASVSIGATRSGRRRSASRPSPSGMFWCTLPTRRGTNPAPSMAERPLEIGRAHV